MLHTKILEEKTLELLKNLMSDEKMKMFNLVGGTALSLHLGHRRSIDLDLFTKDPFDAKELRKHLADNYGFIERYAERQTLKGDIDGVFIDCLHYDYPQISPIYQEDNLRITGVPDLIAMKLDAITDSGDREKDFVDIAFFSTRIPLRKMLEYYTTKYHGASNIAPLKALLYFNDIKKNEPLVLTRGKYKWDLIENRLEEMVNNPEKVFETFPQEIDPKIERLKINTIEYALEYATDSGWHKGFPWIRDSFDDFCKAFKEYMNDHNITDNYIKELLVQDVLIECSDKLTDTQKQRLTEAINLIMVNRNNHNLKI